MKKYLFIILLPFFFLGAGCSIVNQKQLPNSIGTTVLETTTTTDYSPGYRVCEDFFPFTAATSTKLYSNPKANFTFKYPSNWVLNPPQPSGNFKNETYVGLNSDENADPCPVLD